MNLLGSLFIASLVVNILNSYVLSETLETCLSYRVETMKNIHLSNDKSSQNYMKVNFDVLLKSQNNSKNNYSIHIREPEVFFYRRNKLPSIDLNKCPSNILPTRHCLLPTLVIVDDNGLFQELRVEKNEPEICINIKLYLASLMQINRAQLKETTKLEKSDKDELFYIGTCPVSYEVNKENEKTQHLHIIKNIQLDQCSRANGAKEDLRASGILEMEASSQDSMLVPQLVLYNGTFIYNIKGEPNAQAHISVDAKVTLRDTISCTAVPSFVGDNAISVIAQHLKPVDENLFNNYDPENSDLTKIYEALASDGVSMNIYQDIYERALKCWEVI